MFSCRSGANTAAVAALNAGQVKDDAIAVRQQKYLNYGVEKVHRNIQRCIRPRWGVKSFRRAQGVLAGIEVVSMIRKGQSHPPKGDGLSPVGQVYLMVA